LLVKHDYHSALSDRVIQAQSGRRGNCPYILSKLRKASFGAALAH
jgi:hypothetical protein